MKKLIIIKYGELTTKHDNINYFIKTLKTNLDESLKDINHNIIFDRGRMYIESDNFDEVLNVASKTFGIHEINIGYEFNDIKEEICYVAENIANLVSQGTPFNKIYIANYSEEYFFTIA